MPNAALEDRRAAVLAEMRDRIARQFIAIVTMLGTVMLATAWVRLRGAPDSWRYMLVFGACYGVLLLAYAYRARLSRRQIVVAIALLGALSGAGSLLALGLGGLAGQFLVMITGMLTLLAGRRAGVVALAFGVTLFAAGWIALSAGAPVLRFDAHAWFANPVNWMAAILQFSCIAVLVLVPIGGMRDGLIRNAGTTEAARRRLVEEMAARQRAERALRASEARFSAAFRDGPDAVAILHAPDGGIVDMNEAFERLAGLSRRRLLNRPIDALVALGERASHARLLEAVRERGHVDEAPMRVLTPQGEAREMLVAAALLRVGEDSLILEVLRDVSEERAAEREVRSLTASLESQVREQTAALEEATRDLETLTYAVSHHLRAPIRALNAYARLLAGTAPAPSERERLVRLEAQASRMGAVVDALLELARIHNRALDTRTVDLSALARSVVAELERSAPARRVAVRIAPGLVARADRALVRLALEHLIGNAWKFTASTEAPEIAVGRDADGFYVRDNGIGFEPAEAAALFRAFVRPASAKGAEGVGVGLAAVARIVRRHGGQVSARGAPGRGATIHFTLPEPVTLDGIGPAPQA